jgi:hypothetical protein
MNIPVVQACLKMFRGSGIWCTSCTKISLEICNSIWNYSYIRREPIQNRQRNDKATPNYDNILYTSENITRTFSLRHVADIFRTLFVITQWRLVNSLHVSRTGTSEKKTFHRSLSFSFPFSLYRSLSIYVSFLVFPFLGASHKWTGIVK